MTVLVIAADVTAPQAATAEVQPTASGNKYAAPSASPSASSSAGQNPAGFNAVDDQTQMQSGEALLIEAYIAIWVLLFGFIFVAWRRTRRVEDKIADLEKAIDRAKTSAPIPTTKRSASEPPLDPEKA